MPHEPRATRRLLLGIAFAHVVLVTSICSAQITRPPNVILIVSDDQRPDTIHAVGSPHIDTPNLDRLVRAGASFTRAIAANPHCTPSRAELMTGATGFRSGSPPFGRAIRPEMVLWANAMRQAGYHAWYSGKWMNDGTPRTRGYDETLALFSGGGASRTDLTSPIAHNGRPVTGYTGWTFKTNDGAPELEKGIGLTPIADRHIADGAIAFIARRPTRPFFLHVNFTAPHDPLFLPPGYEKKYSPDTMPLPPNFLPEHPFDHGNAGQRDEQLLPLPRNAAQIRAEIAAYYAMISYMDEQIGRILDALRATGQEENTIVIFTSDHGLAMGSHGLMGKQNMYDHTIGVPLIMAGPRIPRNKRFAAQAYLYDLYPTVCELTGIPIPATVEGRSLVPILSERAREIYPEVYAYWHRAGAEASLPLQRMIRTERWKLIYYSHLDRMQLFDLQADPHELADLSSRPEHRKTMTELRRRLDDWFAARTKRLEPGAAQPHAKSG